MTAGWQRHLAEVLLAGLLLCVTMAGCSANSHAVTPTAIPAPLVGGAPSSYLDITVSAGEGAPADVPPDLRPKVAPLVAARTFPPLGDAGAYGLDSPSARLVYRDATGSSIVVMLGGTTFDGHGVYARRQGSDSVSVVLADDLRPVLALVAVTLPPAT